jgi:erythromycin esterase
MMGRESALRSTIIFIGIIFFFITSCRDKLSPPTFWDDEPEPPPPPVDSILTTTQQQYVGELNAVIHPLSQPPLNINDDALNALEFLGQARVVGLGEATHGSKEFFEMKHRIFRYLVERHGFKAFGFECDFAESLFFDEYITTGEGDLEDLMRTRMHFWCWKTEEVKVLLEWMRDYNAGKNEEDMIHYYGFDCQFMTYQGEFLIEYLEEVSPPVPDSIRTFLEYTTTLSATAFEDMTSEQYGELENDIQNLYDYFEGNEAAFTASSSLKEVEIAKQLVRTMEQNRKSKENRYQTGSSYSYRDDYMAENTLWIADFVGVNAKIAAWAHNGHVANDDYYGGSGSMGYHLRQRCGDSYHIVGFGFSKGGFTAYYRDSGGTYHGLVANTIVDEPLETSVNFLFHHAQYDDFILKLDEFSSGAGVRRWLASYQPFLSVGSLYNGNPEECYRDISVRIHFDAVVYFDEVDASVLVN